MNNHYYTKQPTSTYKEYTIQARLRGTELTFFTGSGVFSPKRIDLGTQLLANKAIIQKNWSVLDLGCGYGAVGISIAKAIPIQLTMTDINQRAVRLAKKNAKQHKITATIVHGDAYEAVTQQFDTILLNPPQTAGKQICLALIEKGKKHLKPNGLFQLVARHQKGGKTFEEKLKEVFGNVKTIAKQSGYRIYVSANA